MSKPPQKPDLVFVRGLVFEANHGYTEAERRSTRRFRLDIELSAALSQAAKSDDLGDTIDYRTVCEVALAICTKETFKLLEALAGRVARQLHEHYPKADITLCLEKLAPPCPGVPESCGVRITFPSPRST